MIRSFQYKPRFERQYKRLDPETQKAVDEALELLKQYPLPGKLRHHTLSGTKPKVHVVDVKSNHSYQLTFHLDGDEAVLLRVGTHAQIDISPD